MLGAYYGSQEMGALPQFYTLLLAIALLPASSLLDAAPPVPVEPQTARITWGDWPPFHSRSLANDGLYSHLIREAYNAVGVSVEFGVFPWKRALLVAQTPGSSWHGTSGWVKTPERDEIFLYTDAIHKGCIGFFHKSKTPFNWERAESIKGLRVGVTSGFSSNALIKKMKAAGLDISIREVSEAKFGIRMLNAERIDAFINDESVGQSIINRELKPSDVGAIIFHPQPLFCDSYRILFPKEKPESQYLIQQFNAGLKILRENGRYREIMGKL